MPPKQSYSAATHFGGVTPWLSKAEGFNLPNHDTGRILPTESQVNVTDSSVTNYDSVEESTSVSTEEA
ncbi:hypothetical protein Tco_0464022, partial [Tanacetum coccineum]